MNIEEIRSLYEKKKENLKPEEKEGINILSVLLKDDNIFFNIPRETAMGILAFLGIEEDKLENTYFELISPKNFIQNKGYIIQNEGDER